MRTDDIVRYIVSFLLGEEDFPTKLTSYVGYTSRIEEMANYKVVIIPSGFFEVGVYGTEAAYPTLPLKEWQSVPVLFGQPFISRAYIGGPVLIHADIIASTYFLISRYEEMYRREVRDAYGRFPGKESLPYKAGFIHRPIVDEYGVLLREILKETLAPLPTINPKLLQRLQPRSRKFARVYLTHDIDQPYEYQGLRSFARAYIKESKSLMEAYKLAFRPLRSDRYFTFTRFLDWDREIARRLPKEKTKIIFFYKTPSKHPVDKPNYQLSRGVGRTLREVANKYHVYEAYHIPYQSALEPWRMEKDLRYLKINLGAHVTHARHHYLAAREPEDYLNLLNEGILDDYSMGYPDVAGFRLGTCRRVHFILPSTGMITNLILHPITLMDCTLHREHYMALSAKEALHYAYQLLLATAQHHGELCLLFHNDLLAKEVHPYHSRLYRELLRTILRIESAPEDDTRPLEEIAPCPQEF